MSAAERAVIARALSAGPASPDAILARIQALLRDPNVAEFQLQDRLTEVGRFCIVVIFIQVLQQGGHLSREWTRQHIVAVAKVMLNTYINAQEALKPSGGIQRQPDLVAVGTSMQTRPAEMLFLELAPPTRTLLFHLGLNRAVERLQPCAPLLQSLQNALLVAKGQDEEKRRAAAQSKQVDKLMRTLARDASNPHADEAAGVLQGACAEVAGKLGDAQRALRNTLATASQGLSSALALQQAAQQGAAAVAVAEADAVNAVLGSPEATSPSTPRLSKAAATPPPPESPAPSAAAGSGRGGTAGASSAGGGGAGGLSAHTGSAGAAGRVNAVVGSPESNSRSADAAASTSGPPGADAASTQAAPGSAAAAAQPHPAVGAPRARRAVAPRRSLREPSLAEKRRQGDEHTAGGNPSAARPTTARAPLPPPPAKVAALKAEEKHERHEAQARFEDERRKAEMAVQRAAQEHAQMMAAQEALRQAEAERSRKMIEDARRQAEEEARAAAGEVRRRPSRRCAGRRRRRCAARPR